MLIHSRHFKKKLSTKRATVSGVRRDAAVANLSNIRCSDVFPLDPTAQQEARERGVSVDKQIFCDAADIVSEDLLTVNGTTTEYTVVEVARYPEVDTKVLHLSLRLYQAP